jgi:hypothetical protein
MSINLEIFRKTLIYEMTAPVSPILEDLEQIAVIDRAAEAQQNKFRQLRNKFLTGMGISILVAFISIFLLSQGSGSIAIIGFLLLGLGILGFIAFLIAAIYAESKKSFHGRFNLPNQRYELLKQVLQMVVRDMEPAAEVSVRLVLSPPSQKNKLIQTVPHRYKTGFKVDFYQDEWLTVNGNFLDKTEFLLTTTECNQTAYGWKRSSSGKSKYKTKSKPQGLEVDLKLNYPLRRYGAIKVVKEQAVEAVKLPEKVQLKNLKITDKDIRLSVKIPPFKPSENWNQENLYQTITMMFLSLYQVLNLSRILSKK